MISLFKDPDFVLSIEVIDELSRVRILDAFIIREYILPLIKV